MTQSTLTAEKSTRDQLLESFQQMSQRAFDHCMDNLRKVNFYDEVLHLIQSGRDISTEVPETVGMRVEQVTSVVQRLRQQAEQDSRLAWELSAALAGSFKTKVSAARLDGELIPQFTVEHVAKTGVGQVRISVATWRRKVSVEIVGSDQGVEDLNAEMAFSALKAR